ncbi:cytoskeleton-associated protein 4 [Genypterus blacodes]|uniref:cytoskeleton-associated protein 4 n=1 Tax=Genypterus blacodes TaxID=154954 RepID=UPI003F76B16A
MTAKNRQKQNNSSEKTSPPSQEDAPKKSQKSASSNGMSGSVAQGPSHSRSCVGLIVSVVCYIAVVGAAGFAAFYLQQVVEEIRLSGAKQEESAQQSAELSTKMESVIQQVESLSSVVDGLESSLGITRVELEGTISRMKRGEGETRKVEETIQKLQKDLLRDLTEGIDEVKEASEKDLSSLETTVEERLAELSQSIATSMTAFAESQGEAQSQLEALNAKLGDMEDPSLLKQELSAIVESIAEIKTEEQVAKASADSLREQIGTVSGELHTRNKEVASLSEEIEGVRTVMQQTVGSLKKSLSAAEASVQAVMDKAVTLESGVGQATEAIRSVEKEVKAVAAQAQKRSDDLEARVKASEDSEESLQASVSEITSKVKTLLTKYETHESALAAQREAAEKAKNGLEKELGALKSSFAELQSNMAVMSSAQTRLISKDTSLGVKVEDVEARLAAQEDSSGKVKPEQVESLRGMINSLEGKAAKLEGHEKAISALQNQLTQTTKSLADLSKQLTKENEVIRSQV